MCIAFGQATWPSTFSNILVTVTCLFDISNLRGGILSPQIIVQGLACPSVTAFELRLHQLSGTRIITGHDSERQGEGRPCSARSGLADSLQDTYEPNSKASRRLIAPQASPRAPSTFIFLILGSLTFALIPKSFHTALLPFRNVTTRHRVPLPPQCHPKLLL